MLCYEKLINPTILGQRTKLRKRLDSYLKNSEKTKLKKQVNGNHFLILRNFGKKLNTNRKKTLWKDNLQYWGKELS
jgi:hypothetical protein